MDRNKFEEMMAKNLSLEPMEKMKEAFEEHVQEGTVKNAVSLIEAVKINLEPGEVLFLTIKNDDLDYDSLTALRKQLEPIFPNNKVVVLGLGTKDGAEFNIVSKEDTVVGLYLGKNKE